MSVWPLQIPVDDKGRFSPDGKLVTLDKFAIGALSGVEMAFQDLKTQGFDFLRTTDYVIFRCTEVQRSEESGMSDMPLFEIDILDKFEPAPPLTETK